jgi:hypothetical protein
MRAASIPTLLTALLLAGCRTPAPPPEPLVADADAMLYLEPGLRPESLLFPEYLLMEDFELDQHGRIPDSRLVGVDLKSKLALNTVLWRVNDLLASKDWKITKTEMGQQSFRLMASLKDETLEIRAVQGTGPTQMFVLYQSSTQQPAADSAAN